MDDPTTYPPAGTYTVIINTFGATRTAWIRNGYSYDGMGWTTPGGKQSKAKVYAYYKEEN